MEPSMRVGAVNVFEDNEGAIKLATNKHASRRTKHIDVKHHLVRDASDARKVRVALLLLLFSHIQRIGCQPEKKLLYTVANPARGLLNRKKKKKKSLAASPPPPRAARLEKIKSHPSSSSAARVILRRPRYRQRKACPKATSRGLTLKQLLPLAPPPRFSSSGILKRP